MNPTSILAGCFVIDSPTDPAVGIHFIMSSARRQFGPSASAEGGGDRIGGLLSCRRHGLNVAQDMVVGFKVRANGTSPGEELRGYSVFIYCVSPFRENLPGKNFVGPLQINRACSMVGRCLSARFVSRIVPADSVTDPTEHSSGAMGSHGLEVLKGWQAVEATA